MGSPPMFLSVSVVRSQSWSTVSLSHLSAPVRSSSPMNDRWIGAAKICALVGGTLSEVVLAV